MILKKELQIFLFTWLKTFKRSITIFLHYFWWLIALQILLKTHVIPCHYRAPLSLITLSLSLVTMIFVYLSILSIRASIEVKNLTYFTTNFKKIIGFALLYGGSIVLLRCTSFIPMSILLQNLIIPFFLIAMLFFLDSDSVVPHVFKALINAAKGVGANIPLFATIAALYLACYSLLTLIFSLIPTTLFFTTSILLLNFFFTCAISILYLKM